MPSNLLCLPNEVLENIARNLDLKSLMAFGLSHERLRAVAYNLTRRLKFTSISMTAFQYISVNGSSLEDLDLSDCSANSDIVSEVVMNCPNLRHLNVVNSALHYGELLQAVEFMPQLEALEFTLLVSHSKNSCSFRLKELKHLYVEAMPSNESFDSIIDLLNNTDVIESVHVNFIGQGSRSQTSEMRSTLLAPERWCTLSTFVCSQNLSNSQELHVGFLKRIFASKLTEQVCEWIQEKKASYVYENGNFNGTDLVFNDNVNLMNRFHHLTFSDANRFRPIPHYPWGAPQALRVSSSVWESRATVNGMFRYISSSLVELDLSDCHSDFPEEDRLDVLAEASSLETLVVPLCFFLVPLRLARVNAAAPLFGDRKSQQRAAKREEAARLCSALKNTKLRKLIIKGCSNDQGGACCLRCGDTVTSDNIPQLNDLPNLEELTLSQLTVDVSGYRNLANSNAHTVRLCLNEGSSLSGLFSFVRRCTNLQNFKYEAPNLPMDREDIWEALLEAKNLKQLCLGSVQENCDFGVMRRYVLQLVESLDFLHIHADAGCSSSLYNALEDKLSGDNTFSVGNQTVLLKSTHPSLKSTKSVEVPQHFPGRSLCCTESFVAVVKPLGWHLE